MNRGLLALACIALGAASQAVVISNSQVHNDFGAVGSSVSVTGNQVCLSWRDLIIKNGQLGTVAWDFDFASDNRLPYQAIEFTIDADLVLPQGGIGGALGTEKVWSTENGPAVPVGDGLLFESNDNPGHYVWKTIIPLTQATTKGHVQKDISFSVQGENSVLQINKICQNFVVPEPGSVVALAVGGLALLGRRRKA